MQHRIIVVGCGSMAKTWVEDAVNRPNAEILAFVDILPEAAEAMRDAYHQPNASCHTTLEAALEAHPEASLVLDVTIPQAHEATATLAMQRGLDVFSEKPMADSLEACNRLVEVSRATGRTYSLMQNRRYDHRIQCLRDMVLAGEAGKGGFLCADFFLGPHFGGFRDIMESPLVLDMAVHTFDQARYITGSRPVSVYCHEFNPAGSWYQGDSSAIAIFEMEDGSVFCYRGSWSAEGCNTSWESQWRYQMSNGTLLWDGTSMPTGEKVAPEQEGFIRAGQPVTIPAEQTGREFHLGCFDELYASLEKGVPAQTDCQDNLHTMRMVFGAMQSAREGRKIVF